MTRTSRTLFLSLSAFALGCTALSLNAQTNTKPSTPAAPAKTEVAADGSVLGQIGDIKITAGELRAVLGSMGVKEGNITSTDAAALSQLVRNLLVQKLVLREAQDQGWDQQPEVKAQIARALDTLISEGYVQTKAAPPETFPSEAELKAAYESNKAALVQPKSYRLAQIFIATPKEGGADAEKAAAAKLETVKKALAAAGADFAKVASEHSEETQTAGRGGEIGWLAETQVQPEIAKKLPGLKAEAVTEAIRLDDGWHIVKVLDIRESFTPTLEQVRVQLRQRMRAERTKANVEAYMAELVKQNPVAINELALSTVLPAPATPAAPADTSAP